MAKWLDKYPNLYIDIDARISELGRQPYTARKFLIKYQDRVLFGTDTPPNDREAYRIYYRFLETDDEYFDCQKSHHLQGFWMIYGVFLPKDVLAKMYYKNAERLLYFGDNAAKETSTARPRRSRPAFTRLREHLSNGPSPDSGRGARGEAGVTCSKNLDDFRRQPAP